MLCGIKKDRGKGPFYFEGTVLQTPTTHALKEGISEHLDHKLAFPNVFQQDGAPIH
jgi:hypothetical protein